MTRALRTTTIEDLDRIGRALADLRAARENLKMAGAPQAAKYVARAEKSAAGAYRHAIGSRSRTINPNYKAQPGRPYGTQED